MPSVLNTALGLRPRVVFKTSGKVFHDAQLLSGEQHEKLDPNYKEEWHLVNHHLELCDGRYCYCPKENNK